MTLLWGLLWKLANTVHKHTLTLSLSLSLSLSHTHTPRGRGRYVWPNNKFLYTAHNRLQIKHTDRPSAISSCTVVSAGTCLSLPPRSQFQSLPWWNDLGPRTLSFILATVSMCLGVCVSAETPTCASLSWFLVVGGERKRNPLCFTFCAHSWKLPRFCPATHSESVNQ